MKNLGQITDPKDIPTKEYVDSQISTAGDGKFLPLVDGGRITNSEHPSLTGTLISSTGIAVDGDNEPHARYGTEAYFYQKSEASDAMTEISYSGVYISKGGANKELTGLHPNLLEFKSSNGVVSGLATPTTNTQAANKAYVDALGSRVSTNEDNIAMAESDIESLQTDVSTLKTDNTANQAAIKTLQDTYVPNTRKINNKSLDNDITLTASDIDAISQTDADNRYLKLTGGTLSGLLTINKTDAVDGSSSALLSLRSNKFPNSTRYTVDDKGLIRLINPTTGDSYLYYNPTTKKFKLTDYDNNSKALRSISMDYSTDQPKIKIDNTTSNAIYSTLSPTELTINDVLHSTHYTKDNITFSTLVELNANGTLNLAQDGESNTGIVKGLANPTQDDYAANKAYVDSRTSQTEVLTTIVNSTDINEDNLISVVDIAGDEVDIATSDATTIYFQYEDNALYDFLTEKTEYIAATYEFLLDISSSTIERYPLYKLPEPIRCTAETGNIIYYTSGIISLKTTTNQYRHFIVFGANIMKSDETNGVNRLIFINLDVNP